MTAIGGGYLSEKTPTMLILNCRLNGVNVTWAVGSSDGNERLSLQLT